MRGLLLMVMLVATALVPAVVAEETGHESVCIGRMPMLVVEQGAFNR
jgi:hypothetical protein